MLIDASVFPLRVTSSECPHYLVVRVLRLEKTRDDCVGRLIEYHPKTEALLKQPYRMTYRSEETLTRGGFVCMEYRLPLEHVWFKEDKKVAPNPFLVVSFYRDQYTNKVNSWTLQVSPERRKPNRWLITVSREDQPLVTVADEYLGEAALWNEPLPLSRLKSKDSGSNEKVTVWDHLLMNEAFDPELPDGL